MPLTGYRTTPIPPRGARKGFKVPPGGFRGKNPKECMLLGGH